MADFFPRKSDEQVLWLTNFKATIKEKAVVLGLSDAQIAQMHADCTQLIEAIFEVQSKKKEFNESVKNKDSIHKKNMGRLRKEIARLKLLDGYQMSDGLRLGVVSKKQTVDLASYKVTLSVETFSGFARIRFVKKGIQGIALYHRKKGESNWSFLCTKTKSPYDHHIVLENERQPEHWEYKAYAIVNDEEVGLPSNIVEAIIGL